MARLAPCLTAVAVALSACQQAPLDLATPEPVADSVAVSADRPGAAAAAVTAAILEGFDLRLYELDAGLVETEYVDFTARLTAYDHLPLNERQVRFRFLVQESAGAGSMVAVQVLQNPWFPTPVSRYYERAVASDHPATELARRILARVDSITSRGG